MARVHDPDGLEKDVVKYLSEFRKVRAAWKTQLTKRGGLHKFVDRFVEGARVSAYWAGKTAAIALGLAVFFFGTSLALGLFLAADIVRFCGGS